MPKVIAFVARLSGTGKTTLVEQLIGLLKERGYRVGAIKHDAHKFEVDKPGKDSYRFTAAGADSVLVASSTKLALMKRLEAELSLEELIGYFPDVDIVVIEGFKNSTVPKIEVHRREHGELLCGTNDTPYANVIAVASDDSGLQLDVPLLDLNNAGAIVDFVIEKIING